LWGRGVILPIDWESAAIGAPEIDLAFLLLEGWSADDRVRVLRRYAETRWSGAAPPDFGARFDAAVMFTQFRWLGDRLEWTADRENQWRFKLLLEYAFKETSA
jgi:thiamine kinase-like enzyme